MRSALVAFTALALTALALTGCGRSPFEAREPWRREAEEACLARGQVAETASIVRVAEMDGPGACGIDHPFRVTALADGTVGMKIKMTLGCPMIPQLDGWIAETVQPAAELYLGTRVAEIRSGSYSCRGRNNQRGAKLSEHGFGNAADIMSFRFADGRELTVEHGWRGAPADQDFLREVFLGACQRFTTVLGPGSDVFHYNHFHLDLARHDPAGRRHICKPIIKFTPRLPEAGVAQSPRAYPRPARDWTPAAPQAPIDVEEDPAAVEEMSARPAPAGRTYAAAPAAPSPAPRRDPVASGAGPLAAGPSRGAVAAPGTLASPNGAAAKGPRLAGIARADPADVDPSDDAPAPMPPPRPSVWSSRPIY